MAVNILHLDFETRSTADLRKIGHHAYAQDPTTDILCAGYSFNDGPIKIWTPGQALPADLVDHIVSGLEVWAHNAHFELSILNHVCAKYYGWPSIALNQMVCTMAMAYAMGLPGSLDGCAAALGVTERKDLSGGRLMLQLSKPKEITDRGGIVWWEDQERLNKLYDYCRQDVVVERAVGKRMPRLSPYEHRVWQLDWEVNNRGITVDIPAVKNAIALVQSEKDRLNAEMRRVSENHVASCTAVQQIKDYLEFFGVTGESMDKAAVGEKLADVTLHPTARKVLELRAEAGKAATAKLEPMLASAGSDSRVRGCFQYSGANTRRWAGRRIQLHNLKRSSIKFNVIENILADIAKGTSAEELSLYYGPPLHILGDCIRSFLIAAPGQELLVADFASIEARVLAWLAGQESTLDIFRAGQDIYKAVASQIFGVEISAVNDSQRQVGKVAVLALGYGGGVGAFQTMAKGYNVKMEPAFGALWKAANPEQRIRAEETFKSNKNRFEISAKEFLASDLTKILWREANSKIADYWYNIESMAIAATLNPGKVFATKPGLPEVKFRKAGSFLWCQLPGGGVICYPYPQVNPVKTPWGAMKDALTYMAEDGQTHKWQRFSCYGGSLVENITQAVSRDILADAMLRLEDAAFKIVAHVHDEIICEMPKGVAALSEMIRIMTINPSWAKGLPISAAGFVSKRYRK